MMICYCLYPFIWANGLGILLSNILTEDEMAVYTLVIALGVALLLYMFFFGIISIHEYGLVQYNVYSILFLLSLIYIFIHIIIKEKLYKKKWKFVIYICCILF